MTYSSRVEAGTFRASIRKQYSRSSARCHNRDVIDFPNEMTRKLCKMRYDSSSWRRCSTRMRITMTCEVGKHLCGATVVNAHLGHGIPTDRVFSVDGVMGGRRILKARQTMLSHFDGL
jgi:hypothetical protein